MLNLQPELIAASGLLSFLPRKQLGARGKLREIEVRSRSNLVLVSRCSL